MAKRVTIKEIAQEAGVSFQIVSKVLKNEGRVTNETRQRILNTADRLGYVPNRIARSLVHQRTRMLGFLASHLTDYVLTQFLVGAEQETRRQGYSFIVVALGDPADNVASDLKLLLEQQADGILLAAPQLERNPDVPRILAGRVPVVSIHRVEGDFASMVGSNQTMIGEQATRHLLDLGYRKIGMITGTMARQATHGRSRGYRQALQQFNLPYDEKLVEEGDWHAESGHKATLRLLKREPGLDAIFAQSDLMAIGALHALADLKRRVPEDCAVIGVDDIPTAVHTIPPLSTVHVPILETGQVAVRHLLETIEKDESREVKRILLPTRVVCRQSTSGAIGYALNTEGSYASSADQD
jgi:LacI family transcriptional regulator